MARTIPATPATMPEATALVAGQPIIEGNTDPTGRLLDLGRAINLGFATGNAAPVVSQRIADGQMVVNSAIFTPRMRWAIPPPPSTAHNLVQVAIFGRSPSGNGIVRFRSVNGAGLVDLALGAGLQWWDSAAPHLPIVAAGGPAYEEITIETDADVEIDYVYVTYLAHDPSGFWPGADGALAAGAVGAFVPLDDNELAADAPLSSDLAEQIRADLIDLDARQRIYMNVAGFAPHLGLGVDQVIERMAHQVVAVQHWERNPSETLTMAVYSVNAAPLILWVQHTADFVRFLDFANPGRATRYVIPITAGAWSFHTIRMGAGRFPAPRRYPGLNTLGFFPSSETAANRVESVAIWGR